MQSWCAVCERYTLVVEITSKDGYQFRVCYHCLKKAIKLVEEEGEFK
jgi:hypothetical protein